MSNAAPNDEAVQAYEKIVAASGAINQDALLCAFIDGHEAGKVDPESGRAFLIKQRAAHAAWFDSEAAAALEAGKAAKAAGTTVSPKMKWPQSVFADETAAGEAARIALIKSKGTAWVSAEAAKCDPPRSASGKLLRPRAA